MKAFQESDGLFVSGEIAIADMNALKQAAANATAAGAAPPDNGPNLTALQLALRDILITDSLAPPSGSARDTAIGASRLAADTDRRRLTADLRDRFRQCGVEFRLPAELLAAIASRESRIGDALDANGEGDHGNAFGIMQVDKNFHPIDGPEARDGLTHIRQGARILRSSLDSVRRKHPDWPEAAQLKGAVAAYNFGVGNVRTIAGIDIGTAHNNYGFDVVARANAFAADFVA